MTHAKLIMAGLTAAVLAGCGENDTILPGKREDLRAPFGETSEQRVLTENVAQRISLPSQSANANWQQRIGTPATRTPHPALASQLTGIQWSTPIGAGDSRRHRITADPVIADGRIFVMDSKSTVTAVSLSGAPLWSVNLTPERDRESDAGGGGLAYGDGKLIVTSGFGMLRALDPSSGATLWEQDLLAATTGTPAVSRGLVYVVGGDNVAWAVNADSGRVEWQLEGSDGIARVSGGPAPAVGEDLVVFAYGTGELQAAFRQGGTRRWDATVAGSRRGIAATTVSDITGDPVIDGNTIYAGSYSGRIVALNRDSGARLWTAKDGALGPVWPAGGSVFAVTDRNELVRLDAGSGERIWGTRLPFFTKEVRRRSVEIVAHYGPVVAGGRVIVGSNDGVVRSYDPVSGELLSSVAVPGGVTTNPVVAGNTLYVVSAKGVLHALR
ncbi:outer membrane protein assembly factor BamB [Planktotalea frisia]|mgnify:FL=1|uniref:Outer membrane protein assembly factor BamB n=1 Tax=Planktotalea frisia TaxID=696762 RepID=A0A1L9NRB7_9RHOB|nr:PQQ-like beta-propeller repeat protein [Planktotalea frisia]OJI91848.1 outer membrane protein assembly factor BamB precursor [Planktotalea frisia]PZX32957.1 outer membrane protein assembly factor BamB [Planktotalea frisia]